MSNSSTEVINTKLALLQKNLICSVRSSELCLKSFMDIFFSLCSTGQLWMPDDWCSGRVISGSLWVFISFLLSLLAHGCFSFKRFPAAHVFLSAACLSAVTFCHLSAGTCYFPSFSQLCKALGTFSSSKSKTDKLLSAWQIAEQACVLNVSAHTKCPFTSPTPVKRCWVDWGVSQPFVFDVLWIFFQLSVPHL